MQKAHLLRCCSSSHEIFRFHGEPCEVRSSRTAPGGIIPGVSCYDCQPGSGATLRAVFVKEQRRRFVKTFIPPHYPSRKIGGLITINSKIFSLFIFRDEGGHLAQADDSRLISRVSKKGKQGAVEPTRAFCLLRRCPKPREIAPRFHPTQPRPGCAGTPESGAATRPVGR